MISKRPLNIAIIGTGSAGASAALYLKRQGHQVIVFEREKEPKPVGAGVMLQPTGLTCLNDFDLAENALKLGTPIHAMVGKNTDQKNIIDFTFDPSRKLFGLGIHRSGLYFLLFNQLKKENIEVHLSTEICEIQGESKKTIYDTEGRKYENFDLVIVANGARSSLRKNLPIVKVERVQKFGALWSKIPFNNSRFNNKIIQYYEGSKKMVGFMPIGKPSLDQQEYVNFFWSINLNDVDNWANNTSLEEWKSEILKLAPDYADVLENLVSKDDVMVAPYMDVELSPSYYKNIVFIGDAAHPMSPQLSQGASFAMLDAKFLSDCLAKHSSIEKALNKYHHKRSKQVYFYQKVSRAITPLFQSDKESSWLRDTFFDKFCKVYPTNKIIKGTILGYRESIFDNLNPKYYVASKHR